MLEIHLRHLQYVATVCQEHIPALAVFRHILVLAFLERFQFGRDIKDQQTQLLHIVRGR